MKHVRIVTLNRLNRALARVWRELERHGLLDEKLDAVDVYLVPLGSAYGWQCYGSGGGIDIPALSLCRLKDWLFGGYVSLADVLRHEYGHALADTHRGLLRSRKFREAFDGPHESGRPAPPDPERHVTPYASVNPSEDFAENFMLFLKHGGRLPRRYERPAIRRRWRFIRGLCRAVKRGRRRPRTAASS